MSGMGLAGDKQLQKMLDDGFILYPKNGIIGYEKAPVFGEVTLKYSNGFQLAEIKITKK